MRNRVSMRFARLRHGSNDEESPPMKISHPTLKHSSVAFSTGTNDLVLPLSEGKGAAEGPHAQKSANWHSGIAASLKGSPRGSSRGKYQGDPRAEPRGSPSVDMMSSLTSPGRQLPLPEQDSGFADMLKIVDDNLSDEPPELSESPAMARESQSEPREMFFTDEKKWPEELDLRLGGMEAHRDNIYSLRTSSRNFSVEESSEPVLNPRTTSRAHTELEKLRLELELIRSELAQERSEKAALKKRLAALPTTPSAAPSAPPSAPLPPLPFSASRASSAISPPASGPPSAPLPAPPSAAPSIPPSGPPSAAISAPSAIDEYKQAIMRLNESRELELQERDTRIAMLEEMLARSQHVPSQPRDETFSGRIPRMRMILPVDPN